MESIAMPGKYVAFDIETAKDVPGVDFNWRPHRPLGISCIASISASCQEPRVWFSKDSNGTPLPQMSRSDLAEFVNYVDALMKKGFTPLTWNGLAFDYDIVAEESNLTDQCKQQALQHVDMMFHIVCEKGFPVSLANAAAGMGLQGKLRSVDGCDAPKLWLQGRYEAVINYVAQDVRATIELAAECRRRRMFKWITSRGKVGTMPLPKGWLSVDEAMRLPLPDTSWMSDPIPRRSYYGWLTHT
jgi:hypothetical protein